MAMPTDYEENAAIQAKQLEKKAHRTRMVLFLLLLLASTVPLFMTLSVPNKPTDSTVDFYTQIMGIPDGSTVLIQSDWTTSTRGENGGQFDAIMRILMRKNCKIAIYTMSDAQGPQVARDEIGTLNQERKKAGQREYQTWNDFVNIGFFPNAEGALAGMAANIRAAWAGRKDVNTQGQPQEVFQSPVLSNIHNLADAAMVIMITSTNSFNVAIERLSGKVNMIATVTGVMGPESSVYYASKQIKGLATGIKGVYDLETLMENGINTPGPDGKVGVEWPNHPPVAGYAGQTNYDKGKRYFPTLHIDMTLLILAVVFGNIGMFLSRKKVAQ